MVYGIDENIVQQCYNLCDKIGAVVKDSIVQRSTRGTDKKCPSCGRTVSVDERFCPNCGVGL